MNLALFDFDGTITDREMFVQFIELAAPKRRLRWGRIVLAPLIIGYKLGLVPTRVIRAAVIRMAFKGMPQSVAWAAGKDFAERILPVVIRPNALERIRWHQAQGDTVVVVSGALDVYLRQWCAAHDLQVICSALESRDGVLTGAYLGAQCVAAEKARRVREQFQLDQFAAVYAYGDTPEDRELLELADHRSYRWQSGQD